LGKQVAEVRRHHNDEEQVQKKEKDASFVYPADRDIPAWRAIYMAWLVS
jgi:hypothetical protein